MGDALPGGQLPGSGRAVRSSGLIAVSLISAAAAAGEGSGSSSGADGSTLTVSPSNEKKRKREEKSSRFYCSECFREVNGQSGHQRHLSRSNSCNDAEAECIECDPDQEAADALNDQVGRTGYASGKCMPDTARLARRLPHAAAANCMLRACFAALHTVPSSQICNNT